jgi:transcriptional regulator with XRE-family HTH domain
MDIHDLRACASLVAEYRSLAGRAEKDLRKAIVAVLGAERGSANAIARRVGISAAYLSDIRNGRRKISDAILAKLAKLKDSPAKKV